jgi:hypothetical protein
MQPAVLGEHGRSSAFCGESRHTQPEDSHAKHDRNDDPASDFGRGQWHCRPDRQCRRQSVHRVPEPLLETRSSQLRELQIEVQGLERVLGSQEGFQVAGSDHGESRHRLSPITAASAT